MAAYAQLWRKILALVLPPLAIAPKPRAAIVVAAVVTAGMLVAWLPLSLAVLAVGGTIFITLALLHPILILYLLILVIPFSSLLTVSVAGAQAGLMELLLMLAIALWLLKLLAGRSVSGAAAIIKTGPLLVPLLLFLGGIGLSWLSTFSVRASLIETIKWIEVFLLYLFIFNLLPKQHIKWIVLAIVAVGLIQAILGLYQFLFKVGPAGFLLFDGRFLRAYGTFAQPNPYGGYLGLVLPLALSVTLWAFFEREAIPGLWSNRLGTGSRLSAVLWAVAAGLPLLVMVAALFASQSRGAWLGFAAASLVTLLVRSKKMVMLFTGLVLVIALLGLFSAFEVGSLRVASDGTNQDYTAVTQRFVDALAIFQISDVANTPVTDANFATIERLAHWQAAREMWRDHPWLGVGFGNYAAIYPAYAIGRWQDPLGHAHNYLLNLGAEVGFLGIVTYLIFWFWTFGVTLYVIVKSSGFLKAVAAGGMGIFTHLHIHNLVDNLYVQGMYLHVAIILGIVVVIYRIQPNAQLSQIRESQTLV